MSGSAPSAAPSASAPLPVGVAQVEITPGEPIRLTGYGNRTTPAAVIGGRLWAKALAIGEQKPSVLITADLIGVPMQLVDNLAVRLRKAGVERPQLAVTATHTHTGPSLTGVLPFIFSTPLTSEERQAIHRYTQALLDKLEGVALDALANRQPARVAWTQGRAGFAANRRVLKEGKWAAFGIEPGGPVDPDLPVLIVRSPDGALRAIVVNYAAHATTLEGRENFVHGDWPAAAQAMIQARQPGVVAMITIGPGADSNPNPRGGGLGDVERHGAEIADAIDGLLLKAPSRALASAPVGSFRRIDLPLAPLPERAVWEAQAKRSDAAGMYARSILDRLDRGERLPTRVPYPVQTWTWGDDLAMVFLGGEVVADYGLRLKRELDGSKIWVTAYANDVSFYVPSRRMIPEGGYEVIGSMVYYGHPAPLAEGIEDQIVRTVREMLPEAFVGRTR